MSLTSSSPLVSEALKLPSTKYRCCFRPANPLPMANPRTSSGSLRLPHLYCPLACCPWLPAGSCADRCSGRRWTHDIRIEHSGRPFWRSDAVVVSVCYVNLEMTGGLCPVGCGVSCRLHPTAETVGFRLVHLNPRMQWLIRLPPFLSL